jgi:hypothetical protein
MLGARLSGSPQSRGQAFKTDNHKRSYDSKQRILPHFVCYHVTKILFFNIFTYLWGRGQSERMYTLLHSPTSLCGVDYLHIEVARYISSSVAYG